MQGYGLKLIMHGKNYKWRINATFNDKAPLLSGEKWDRLCDCNIINLNNFPTQTKQGLQVGFAMGSTEMQDLGDINAQLENITGVTGINAFY